MGAFSLELSDDQVQLRDWVHDFAADVVRPAAEEWDRREETPWPIIEEAARIGLYGWEFLAEGMWNDKTGLTLPVAIEELFWGDAGIGMAIMGSGLAAAGIAAAGTQEQIMEWVPQCYGTPGDLQMGAFCSSEADAGSDVSAMRTRAVYDEATDEWVLNGTKTWISNGGIADVHVVIAVVDPEFGSRGHASFVVPPNTPGFSQGQKFSKHGIRASHTAEVVLDDVRIPGSCLLVELLLAAFEYARDYAKERVQFGKPIVQHQAIAFMLADMATEIDAARLLVWRAAWLAKQGGFVNAEGSMAKLKAGRVAVWATERAMQILGGAGYVTEHPVERWHRDSKIYDIFEGTEQIQQLVISRAVSGMRIE